MDPGLEILGPIDDEINDIPYAIESFEYPEESERGLLTFVSIVYIEDFFTDGRDFAYYITGRANTVAFCGGMFGMQVYSGPIAATPMMNYNSEILNSKRVIDKHGGKEVHSVTSAEARDVEAGMSEKRRGKMKLTSIEEPYIPAKFCYGHLRESVEVVPCKVEDKDMEAERIRIRHNLEAIKRKGGLMEDIINYLTGKLYGEDETQDNSDLLADERDLLIGQLKDAIALEIELEDQKKLSSGAATTALLELEQSLREDKEQLIARFANLSKLQQEVKPRETLQITEMVDVTQAERLWGSRDITEDNPDAVDQYTRITGQGKETAIDILKVCNWDVQAALGAHFDSRSSASEFVTNNTSNEYSTMEVLRGSEKLTIATAKELPKDVYLVEMPPTQQKLLGSKKRSISVSQAPIHTQAGPSGTNKKLKLNMEHEAIALATARRKFQELLSSSDDDSDDALAPSEFTFEVERLHVDKSNKNKLTLDQDKKGENIKYSIERGVVLSRKQSFQTIPDVISSNATNKLSDITLLPIIDAITRDTNQVGFLRSGTPSLERQPPADESGIQPFPPRQEPATIHKSDQMEPPPHSKLMPPLKIRLRNTSQETSARDQPELVSKDELDGISSKLAVLRSMGFIDEKRNFAVLFERVFDLERAVDYLLSEVGSIITPEVEVERRASQDILVEESTSEKTCNLRGILANFRKQWKNDMEEERAERRDSAQESRKGSGGQGTIDDKKEGMKGNVDEKKEE
ncbi:hypothetical protein GQ44DRAFT_767255 [Phaeosphaeriaceae sp. PMI808]|nr:hypothetical protein GQ44DRAFT_767255 [Phaeosphaeriaceae sp. PMI808]